MRLTIMILSGLVVLALLASPVLVRAQSEGMTYQNIVEILNNLVGYVLWFAGIAALAVIIYFGLRMVLAGGDQTKYAEARKGFNWALIGALVIFGVYTIIATVQKAVETIGR